MRKSWDQYFLDIAEEVATRSTCDRLNVGCVIVKGKRIVSTGYNGSVHDQPHCDEVGHLYNDQGRCIRTIHAEQNAILYANENLNGATAYVTHEPCETCAKLLLQAGVKRVVFRHAYANQFNQAFTHGVQWECFGKQTENKLFIISGHSGCGKSSLMKKAMNNELISVTTREMRPNEFEGRDYYFKSQDMFSWLISQNRLIQKSTYSGNSYGVTKLEYDSKINKGNAFVIVNKEGMEQFKAFNPNAVTILFYSPYEDVVRQLKDRGESPDFIVKRLTTYEEEVANKVHYDYVIKNNYGKFNETLDVVRKIIKAES